MLHDWSVWLVCATWLVCLTCLRYTTCLFDLSALHDLSVWHVSNTLLPLCTLQFQDIPRPGGATQSAVCTWMLFDLEGSWDVHIFHALLKNHLPDLSVWLVCATWLVCLTCLPYMTCLFDLSTLCYIAAYQAYPPIDRDPWLSQLPVKMCPPKLACVAWMLLTAFVHNILKTACLAP